jgi:hypothetical protein
MGKKRNLCDWDRKEIESEMATLVSLVNNPKYVCKKCARVANAEEVLCKSQKIKRSWMSKNVNNS